VIDVTGLGAAAREAVARAESTARELGATAVGTEHLLLGLLGVDGPASAALTAAGATVAATRHKVTELAPRREPTEGPLEPTSRASRAIGRSHRFSHQERAEEVGTQHVLLGVLDVEGTAGQLLRGIGVDVVALRAALREGPAPAADAPEPAAPTCPACSAPVDELAFRIVKAVDADGRSGDAVVFSCRACGVVLGVSRTGRASVEP